MDSWLKTVNVWDPKYDFVMHNNHWLTSEWEPSCEQCLASGNKKQESTTLTSSPIKISTSMNCTEPTLKDEGNSTYTNQSKITNTTTATTITTSSTNMPTVTKAQQTVDLNLTPPVPSVLTSRINNRPHPQHQQPTLPEQELPVPNIPVTPIAQSQSSTKAFVTPYTTKKFHDTFTRSTRASTKKMLNQANNPDLINLNETFDLYKSALAETPDPDPSSPDALFNETNFKRQLIELDATSDKTKSVITSPPITATTTTNSMPKLNKPQSNFELLTNYQVNNVNYANFNPSSLQQESNNHPVTSRIPKMPSSKNLTRGTSSMVYSK